MFCDIFENLIEISGLFKLDKIVNLAINDFKSIDQSVEFIILNWLVKYEKTFIEIFNIYYPIFTSDVENGFLSLALIKDFYFSIEDFKNILYFFSLFEDIYYEKLSVYNTFPVNKLNELSDEQHANSFSLEYHLKKRGLI
ncbi:MAG: hypothetical protein IPH57_11385 [Saprospiraceae bacterium]|nr:hypothetical protein [Saprospiraceae bacterium]